ncbi:hypothetical protein V5O48_015411 [Marasmius crinis-equi]|uniref:NADP-dependent L-serine/L-allo-threonine dehydrogenase ydfG n=1 Tax=Marasmius crinis-equi TaxID=585013 RepID=A0ABR3EUP0_9AGAR
MSLKGKRALLTGASMGIGEAIAYALAEQEVKLALLSRSEDKLKDLVQALRSKYPSTTVAYYAVDVGDYEAVDKAVITAVEDLGQIDILINNAGLALGAPARFPDLPISSITQMNNTNINGYMYIAHSVLNRSMLSQNGGKGAGTILNITSTTALEAPPFPGEACYHAAKACQEGFTNSLRNELVGTDIRVLALRPGVVDTHFHLQRVGYDEQANGEFMSGFEPLVAQDVAEAAVFMLSQPANRSVKALDIVPTAQRSLNVFDRKWNERNGLESGRK